MERVFVLAFLFFFFRFLFCAARMQIKHKRSSRKCFFRMAEIGIKILSVILFYVSWLLIRLYPFTSPPSLILQVLTLHFNVAVDGFILAMWNEHKPSCVFIHTFTFHVICRISIHTRWYTLPFIIILQYGLVHNFSIK